MNARGILVFDGLRKKLSSFVEGIARSVGAKEGQRPERAQEIQVAEKGARAPNPVADAAAQPLEREKAQEDVFETRETGIEKPVAETVSPRVANEGEIGKKQITETIEEEIKIETEKEMGEKEREAGTGKGAGATEEIAKVDEKGPESGIPGKTIGKIDAARPLPLPAPEQTTSWKPRGDAGKRGITPSIGIASKIKGLFSNNVEITDAETRAMFSELELALLESDVSPGTAAALVEKLRAQLVGKKVPKDKVKEIVETAVGGAIRGVFAPTPDVVRLAMEKTAKGGVFKIMFLGPNGAGKTTTIAKLAKKFKGLGLEPVISASDTFRAAAIEQADFHAQKIGAGIIRQDYGSDPAAVAFDAVKHAKAQGAAVVLIDTAGRQETNRNLMEEMKKIQRVVAPDYKVFIGEALAGHALVEQVKAFDAVVGVDAIILTKLDCDPKGGNSISIAHDAGKPIIFFGVGQGYDDLVPFDPGFVEKKVLEAP